MLDPRQLTDKDITDLRVLCSRSLKDFAEIFFPHIFTIPFGKMHDDMFYFLDKSACRRKLIVGNRGLGKTQILKIYMIRKLVYRAANFILMGSKTVTQAELDSDNLKQEMVGNELLLRVYGGVRPERADGSFAREMWQTAPLKSAGGAILHKGTRVLPFSWNSSIKGMTAGYIRPDGAYIDDFEDDDSAKSEASRNTIKDFFYGPLTGIFQRSDVVAEGQFAHEILYVGNMLDGSSLVHELSKNPDWETVIMPLCEPDLTTRWPEFMSTESVRKLHREYENAGMLDKFARDIMCEAADPRANRFTAEMVEEYADEDVRFWIDPTGRKLERNLTGLVLTDPARTKEQSSCDTAVVGVLIDFEHGGAFVTAAQAEHFDPGETFGAMISMAKLLDRYAATVKIGFEETGLGEYITWTLANYQRTEGTHYEPLPFKVHTDKDDRIFALLPLLRSHQIKFHPSVARMFRLSLVSMPATRRKDLPDALSQIVPILHQAGKFFTLNTVERAKAFENRMNEARKRYLPSIRPRLGV